MAEVEAEDRGARSPGGCILADGGLSTTLEEAWGPLHPQLWSAALLADAKGCKLIQGVHEDFLAAGARVLTTSSYQATEQGFLAAGLASTGEDAAELLRRSVALASDAVAAARHGALTDAPQSSAELGLWDRCRAGIPVVAASIGPYGAFLADGSEYRGNYAVTEDTLADFHRRKIKVLAACPGADVLAFETVPELREALVIASLMRERPGTPYWVTFQCRDGEHTASGEDLASVVHDLLRATDAEGGGGSLVGVGVNCVAPRNAGSLVARVLAGVRRAGRPMDALEIICNPNRWVSVVQSYSITPASFCTHALARCATTRGESLARRGHDCDRTRSTTDDFRRAAVRSGAAQPKRGAAWKGVWANPSLWQTSSPPAPPLWVGAADAPPGTHGVGVWSWRRRVEAGWESRGPGGKIIRPLPQTLYYKNRSCSIEPTTRVCQPTAQACSVMPGLLLARLALPGARAVINGVAAFAGRQGEPILVHVVVVVGKAVVGHLSVASTQAGACRLGKCCRDPCCSCGRAGGRQGRRGANCRQVPLRSPELALRCRRRAKSTEHAVGALLARARRRWGCCPRAATESVGLPLGRWGRGCCCRAAAERAGLPPGRWRWGGCRRAAAQGVGLPLGRRRGAPWRGGRPRAAARGPVGAERRRDLQRRRLCGPLCERGRPRAAARLCRGCGGQAPKEAPFPAVGPPEQQRNHEEDQGDAPDAGRHDDEQHVGVHGAPVAPPRGRHTHPFLAPSSGPPPAAQTISRRGRVARDGKQE